MEKLANRGASSGQAPSPSWLDGLATWKLVLLVAGAAGAGVTVLMTGVILIAVVGIRLTQAAPGTAAGNKNDVVAAASAPAPPNGEPVSSPKSEPVPPPGPAPQAPAKPEVKQPPPPKPEVKSPPPPPPPPPKLEGKQPPPPPPPETAPVEVKELAVLKGPPGPVRWLELSADGSRLVTASSGIVWDVNEQRQVCICKSPSGFGLVWLSANGQTVLTENGQTFQAWDANTGNLLFTAPTLRDGSSYTAVALSRDGTYLALTGYEWSGRSNGTLRYYTVGTIVVWDVRTQKEKWKVPGVPGEDTARTFSPPSFKTSVSRLAFSPDGDRLAALGEGLRIFALEASTDVPKVVVKGSEKRDGRLEWLSGGKYLVAQSGRQIFPLDPNTGNWKVGFTLAYPRPPQAKPMGNLLPLPQGPETEAPEGWAEHQIVLSADGSRLAAHGIREHEKEKMRNNVVVLWDVPAQRRVGAYKLADDNFNPGTVVIKQLIAPPILVGTGHGSDLRIALSGDGKRLAVADAEGAVRVYSTAQIEAHTRQADSKPPQAPSSPKGK
jgi:WD40 repeat protein